MIKTLLSGVLALLLLAGAVPAEEDKAYDLLFRNGTLDQIDRDATLVYQRDVTNALKPEAAERDTGQVALSIRPGEQDMALLNFRQDDKYRGLGTFPASVGNPMIMYFYETVVRDMAEAAGGSPFYIRNRVKDALVQPSEIETGQASFDGQTVETKTVRLYPFLEDPNRDRMRGFADLELTVTMSDEVPGWYLSLVADARARDSEPPVYRSELRYDRLEAEAAE